MLRNNYIKILLLFFILNCFKSYTNTLEPNNESNENNALHEKEATNEIKKGLYEIINYIINNNFVPGAEKITPVDIDEIIENILNKDEIKNNLLPIIMIQLELKNQSKMNYEQSKFNNLLDYFTSIGFYTSLLLNTLFSYKENNQSNNSFNIAKFLLHLINITFVASTSGKLASTFFKNKLENKASFIEKTKNILQEKKIEIQNTLFNLLLNILEEKVNSY